MKKSVIAGLAMAVAISSGSAFALNEKTNSPYDYRIKTVVYNPMDVVEIDVVVGIATNIVVAPDEEYIDHVFGAEDAMTLTHRDNNIWVRPMAELSDTNLTIVTNKRTYYLVLHYIGSNPVKQKDGSIKEEFIRTPWSMRQATLSVTYKYPFEDMAAANKKLADRRVREALERGNYAGPRNINYQMSDDAESRSIQPLNAWDDYRFTRFVFPPNAELPTLFVIGSDGKESVVNVAVEGKNSNILVAQMTAREWRIRLGDKVVGVVNGNYNPSLGANPNKTVSPDVKRVVLPAKGDNE